MEVTHFGLVVEQPLERAGLLFEVQDELGIQEVVGIERIETWLGFVVFPRGRSQHVLWAVRFYGIKPYCRLEGERVLDYHRPLLKSFTNLPYVYLDF